MDPQSPDLSIKDFEEEISFQAALFSARRRARQDLLGALAQVERQRDNLANPIWKAPDSQAEFKKRLTKARAHFDEAYATYATLESARKSWLERLYLVSAGPIVLVVTLLNMMFVNCKNSDGPTQAEIEPTTSQSAPHSGHRITHRSSTTITQRATSLGQH